MAAVTKLLSYFVSVLLVASAITAQEQLSANDSMKLEQYRVIPDVLVRAPHSRVAVSFPGGEVADMGNELTPTQVHDMPIVEWEAEEGANYTLIMTDPDLPKSLGGEINHWCVVNIPGHDVSKGETVFEFFGSSPQMGGGLHRYIFLLFKQKSGKLEESSYSTMKDDKLGKLKTRFAHPLVTVQNRLELGEPVAVNFYRAQFDENVPKYREDTFKKYA